MRYNLACVEAMKMNLDAIPTSPAIRSATAG